MILTAPGPRDKYEYQLRTLRVPGGVGTTPQADVHKRPRDALAPFSSKRNSKVPVYDSILDDPNLSPADKQILRLEQEGSLLVLAGTESPAKALTTLFFHLAQNPDVVTNLRQELDSTPVEASWTQLEQLPYLSAVIEEANRLGFGVTARTARIAASPLIYTPSALVPHDHRLGFGTVKLPTHTIPAGTPISISTLSAHTADTVFPDPRNYKPEKWLGKEGRALRKFQFAFFFY